MKRSKVSLKLIQYELRNILGNPFVHIFGVALPMLLSILITKAATDGLPKEAYTEVATTVFLGISTIIPLATILMGYSVLCAQEIEKQVTLRMKLFGVTEKSIIISRLISEYLYILVAFVLYFFVSGSIIKIEPPKASGIFAYFICLTLFCFALFMIAHSLANLIKKFGATYAVSMAIYFGSMILSGMMGVTVDKFPKGIQRIANLLPSTYLNSDFYEVWIAKDYNYMPLIQSFIFVFAIAGIMVFLMFYENRRKLH